MHSVIAFALLAAAGGKPVQSKSSVPGGFRFGMTKDEVRTSAKCTLKDVQVTGGLECPDFDVGGTKRNVSFVFGPDGGLKKIQVWFYEGADRAAFEKGVDAMLSHMKKQHGDVESATLGPGAAVTRTSLLKALDAMPADSKAPAKAQLKPAKDPADAFVFASVFKAPPLGFYAFLYYQPPRQ